MPPPPGPPLQKKGQQVPTAAAVAAAVAAATKTSKPPTTAAAKLAAEELENESGYSTSTGTSDTEENGGPPEVWPYGDEVLVYAKARSGGQEFLIGVVEKPNTEHLASAGPMYGNVPLLPSHKTPSSSKFKSKARQPLGAMSKEKEKEEENFDETEELSYVIQTKTDYNQALAPGQPDELEESEPEPPTTATRARRHHPPRLRRSSSITRLFQACEIEGCFPHKRDTVDFARQLLDAQKESGMFVQYDEREQLPRSFFIPSSTSTSTYQHQHQQQREPAAGAAKAGEATEEEEEKEEEDTQQWPFGEDVLVHAVASTGENYCVAVGTTKGAKERFGNKKVPRRGGREMEMDTINIVGMESMGLEVPRVLVREEGMEETMKGREEKWRMSYYEDIPTKIGM
ncbi:hypothetical protein QR685DRAFT_532280 [Neurospora intermedia]|uniref:Uncharacterized protein n=1 Tax=Neurospora intermedia TaxID=5142 RepID=A0ABR3D5S8_NEUIN